VALTGYLAWSFMDNYKWACGYRPRFRLVYPHYATQQRTIKDSGYLYAQIILDNGFLIP
jgi:beta-glucosidase